MTLYQFNLLPQQEQYQATWNNGKHIDTIKEDDLVVNLYAIDKFFQSTCAMVTGDVRSIFFKI
jgi:hypothetical protein